ncbi:hypothetical protein ABG980_00885 [Enterococcus casseliflavus]|uniref:hypothetical protein n=1 Tax=Enterococcus TaxID=1350 RepID=UPI0012E32BEA|nr:hypothetical protein [Enterococcus casseliflavus]MDB1694478.1 hypothetical protein [Enterococcus casseliflavus]MDB1697912.1 hypothetical protein [Enterococcus casseliflavus]MDB1703024.1 hypothetical protein [Enterococcus casseliflavus]MDB1704225.1 hypothetical protein [Enterococcus casseliflavus]MEB6146027.1 hypothetical protein [Enterococcus casseliflavus]
MFLLNKKTFQALAAPYRTEGAAIGYAKWQSFNAITSRSLLVLDDQQLTILALNLFSTKVVQHKSIPLAELKKQHKDPVVGMLVPIRFTYKGETYRFQMQRVILPLGDWQKIFLARWQSW